MTNRSLPPTPLWNDPQETSIHVWWTPAPADVTNQILQIREFPQPWDTARELCIPQGTSETQVNNLLPTSTFEFRLIYEWSDGTRTGPGNAVSADTAAAGCTPKKEKKSPTCVIM